MSDNYKIALAALIHDIGKVMQRADVPIRSNLKKQESIFCKPNKGYYTHKHSLYTVQFIEDLLSPILDEEYLKISAKHHVPETNLEKIIARADWLSAGMDRKEYEDEVDGYNYFNTRLYSIFQDINIGRKYKSNDNYYYELIPLEVSDKIFPKKEENQKRDTAHSKKEYRELFEYIFEKIKSIDLQRPIQEVYNIIHGILEKYTTFIPSSTKHYPDISLFDHLKTTAAIAVCLYEVYKSGEKVDKEFILLEGDVSGIQDFIYKVVEGEEVKKNIAKSLRGRSAYINILIDFMSKYVIKELDLTISNILYCGGGKFQILLPNTSKVKEKIIEIERNIQNYLYQNYKAKIGLVITYIEIDEQGIRDYASSVTEIHDKMQEAKNRKFLNIINKEKNDFFIKHERPTGECKYCHINEARKNEDICNECQLHIDLGKNLVNNNIKYIVYDFNNRINNSDIKVEFGNLGQVHFFRELKTPISAFVIENINDTGEIGRLKFIGNTVPTKEKGKEVASFNDIALLAEGDKKIGILKMDIDNLGLIFSNGLDVSNRSISRISTLSRMIDLFFSGYINKICESLFEEYKLSYNKDLELDNLFYINYSGGDDLLLIGPWDWMLKLAFKIKEKLDEYVCFNPNITVSAGVYICDSKTPIRVTSEEAEKSLEKAKSRENKNSVCIFDCAINWFGKEDSLEKVLKESEMYKDWLQSKSISRSLIYTIMTASKNIKLNERIDFDLIPRIAYSLARNVNSKEIKEKMFKKLITSKIEDSEIEFIKLPLMVTLMKTRDIREVK